MIQITFNFTDIAAAAALFAKLNGNEISAVSFPPVTVHAETLPAGFVRTGPTTVTAAEKAAVLSESARDESPEPHMAAPGKRSAATTARSPRTAAAAPSPSAPSADAPETKTTATPPAADAPSAAEFEYATLQKAVNAAVPKHGKDKLLAIAKAHGADNFKGLPASAWAAAHADVVALGA